MPKVGNKSFPYTAKGKAMAATLAKSTGKKSKGVYAGAELRVAHNKKKKVL